ncbi:Uncharacterised protein [uncultured archaeon]|nr:Uncharacterised protein [uncultured archaeon]
MREPTAASLAHPRMALFFFLLSASPALFAYSVSAGPWQLDTSLNESASRSLMAQLNFQLLPASDAWLISSSTLLLSNPQGLGPNVTLSASCSNSSCSSEADVYQSLNGTFLRAGRLHSAQSSPFRLPSEPNTSPSAPAASLNESDTVLGNLALPVGLPMDWLWLVALVLVLLITFTFLARNRD